MRKLIAILAVGSLVLGLVVAGCGGDDADAQIDKATFVKETTQICKQASGRLAAEITSITKEEEEKPNSDADETQVTIVEKAFIPRLEEELQRIQALGLPEEAEKEAEAFVKAYEGSIEKTKAKAREVALTRGVVPYEGIAVAATRLGISECPIAPVNAN